MQKNIGFWIAILTLFNASMGFAATQSCTVSSENVIDQNSVLYGVSSVKLFNGALTLAHSNKKSTLINLVKVGSSFSSIFSEAIEIPSEQKSIKYSVSVNESEMITSIQEWTSSSNTGNEFAVTNMISLDCK